MEDAPNSEFLEFKDTPQHTSRKTRVVSVRNKSGTPLGSISWFSPWRRYTFFPDPSTILDVKCLIDIATFISYLMKGRV